MPATFPRISVIIPVYNAGAYLPQCLDSLLSQSFTDFEVLLTDDGSTDNSGLICDQYAAKDKRIRVFHQPNGGASAARNYGIDRARGEWICFIDSDDYISKDYLDAFFQYGNLAEDCLNMQGGNLVADTDGQIIKTYVYPDLLADSSNMREIICQYNFLVSSRPAEKLFNKKLLDRISLRFRTDLTVREDAVFVYTYRTYMNSIKLIPVSGYYYRQAFQRSTLCTQNHHYEVFLTLRRILPPLVQQTLVRWQLQDTAPGREVLSYYKDRTCLSIIKSLYAYRANRKKRLAVWHEVFGDKAYFKDPYFRVSSLLKVFLYTSRILPLTLVDIACYVPFRLYYKYVKKVTYQENNRSKP